MKPLVSEADRSLIWVARSFARSLVQLVPPRPARSPARSRAKALARPLARRGPPLARARSPAEIWAYAIDGSTKINVNNKRISIS